MTTRGLGARHPDQPDRAGALMAIARVTQNMMTQRSLGGLQSSLSQAGRDPGAALHRPDPQPAVGLADRHHRRRCGCARRSPTRSSTPATPRTASAWLGQIDTDADRDDRPGPARPRPRRSRASTGALGPAARESLAVEVDQIREGLIASANTTYLGRPVFGGITAGAQAYDASGDVRRHRRRREPHRRRRRDRRRPGGRPDRLRRQRQQPVRRPGRPGRGPARRRQPAG